jgi:hypothetical protein
MMVAEATYSRGNVGWMMKEAAVDSGGRWSTAAAMAADNRGGIIKMVK